MFTLIFIFIFSVIALVTVARDPFPDGNTMFGDFVGCLTVIFGYGGFWLSGSFLWLLFEENLYYELWPGGALTIFFVSLFLGGIHKETKRDREVRIQNEEYYKRNAEGIDETEREASNKALLILGAICLIIWFLFLR